VQVVDNSGRVIAATIGVDRTEPIAGFRPSGAESEGRTVSASGFGDGSDFRVVAQRARGPEGPVIIYVASSLEPVDETIGILASALAIGAPLILALVGLTTWAVTGRALRPVEAIRTQVADISDRSLDQRVPASSTDDEISRLAHTMNTMLDRLETAAERQRRFLADASHELKTPLASTRTDLEVALTHPDSTDWRATATDLLVANRRMEALVQDLLFLARTDHAAPRPPPIAIDLDDIVLEEAARLQPGPVVIDTSNVSGAAVRGRREDLARAIRNLFDNANHHALAVVHVELIADHEVTLAVADDGPGIQPQDRERIFERFTRLDGDRSRDTGGAGLGLAITKEIVLDHGGTITVEDSPAGARFVIRLPVA
jgi:signal transduction histidine kinase